ncbi:paraneoplastic antigen-like protein 8A [Choloepus didactylus]|uniref:paraneoplastic antigen-like protein 8A n=1 Tax=Choloepus didactylus TaxID=27675 RepID=UPI0018A06F7F|nr:paraneoplastic antigen-like protein 8A [Choloepus didactylus]
MAMNLLEDWCRGMDVDIHRSLLVTGIPEDCGQDEIEETLREVFSPLGPYQVLNKIFLRAENAKAVLIELGEGMNLSTIPRQFPGKGGSWRVVCRDPTQDAEFLKNLNEFLESEGRTVEDVVRLLQLHRPPQPQNPNRPSDSWAETLGLLLGTVVQVICHLDAELRQREEARALEAAEVAAAALAAERKPKKIKEEPGQAADVRSVLKMESPNRWSDTEEEGDPPKPLVRQVRARTPSRRKRQNKTPRQEPVSWRKNKGSGPDASTYLEDLEADDAESMEIPENIRSPKKPRVKQEEPASKKPAAKCARKLRRAPAQGEAAGPGSASESDPDGGREGPPKRKSAAKSLAPGRKRKRVSLGPVSYVLVNSGDPKKKPAIPKKGPGSRKTASVQRAPRGPKPTQAPPAMSRGPKTKPECSPHASNESRKLISSTVHT